MGEHTQLDWLDRLPDATRQAIDYFATRFASEWQSGKKPRLEGYVTALKDANGRPGLLAELLQVEVSYRKQHGEAPHADEYLQRFTDYRNVVEQVFKPTVTPDSATLAPTLLPSSFPSHPIPLATPVAGGNGADIEPTLLGSRLPVSGTVPNIPGYEILKELGRGGMGVVYQARQVGPDRLVALKMILSGEYADSRMLARFLIEGEMLGRLRHPHIVQIFECGTHGDRPYLALEFVSGGSLADRLDGQPMPSLEAARLVKQLAEAVHHAHLQGVVHRDLKPANVLLDTAGDRRGVPKVTDFGLAKPMDSGDRLTATGEVMGTPHYMAPEQARGDKNLGPLADVYALGVILYEALTGRPPFRGETSLETIFKVVHDEPPPPRKLQPRVPLDLETIALKCLEKDPKRRYASAEKLAEELQRYLNREPILARPVGAVERCWKWAQRKPALAALSAAVVVAMLGGFIGVAGAAWYALAGWSEADTQRAQVDRQRNQAEMRRLEAESARKMAETRRQDAETAKTQADKARTEADAARQRAETATYFSAIARARLEWQLNNAAGSRATLESCPPTMRGWEWHYLSNLQNAALWAAPGNPPYVFGVAIRPDGKVVASAGGGNTFFESQGPSTIRPGDVKLWDAQTGKMLALVTGHANVVTGVAFSKDSSLMATCASDGLVHIWDTVANKRLHVLGEPRTVGIGRRSPVFSPDGTRLAVFIPQQVTLWEPRSGKKIADLDMTDKDSGPKDGGPRGGTHNVLFSPDGKQVITSHLTRLRYWDAATGKALNSVNLPIPSMPSISPDGKQIAVTAGRTARILDIATGQLVQVLSGHTGAVMSVQFSPDGKHLATGSDDRTVRLWNLASGAEVYIWRGHRGRVTCLAFDPEGKLLASADEQPGEVRLWEATRHPETTICKDAYGTQAMGFTADGQRLVSVGVGWLRAFNAATGDMQVQHTLSTALGKMVPSQIADVSGDGRRFSVATGDWDGLQVWDVQGDNLEPKLLHTLQVPPGKVYRTAISRDGRRVGTMLLGPNDPGDARIFDAATGKPLTTLRSGAGAPLGAGLYGAIAFSGDGRRVAFDDYGRGTHLQIVDLSSGKVLANLVNPAQDVSGLAMSVDGRLVAVAGSGGLVVVCEAATGKPALPRPLTGADKAVFNLAFSPDGRLLAGITREEVHIWELATGQEVLVLRGAPPRSGDNPFNPRLCWSNDSRRLASLNHNGTISIWSGEPGRP